MSKKRKKVDKPSEIITLQSDKIRWLKGKWGEYLILGSILTIAFVIRLIYLSQIKASDPNFLHLEGTDQGTYDSAAQQILNGTLPKEPYFYNPGYYYFLALLYAIFGRELDLILKLQFLLGLGTYILTYVIAKQIFNKGVAMISVIICSFYGLFMVYEGLFLSAVLDTFLMLLVVFLILKAIDRQSLIWFLLTGLIMGLSAISRPTMILMAPFIVIWIAFRMRKERKQLLLGIIGVCLGIVVAIAPCTIRNYIYSHKFILISSNGPINLWIGNNPDAIGTYYLSPYADILRKKEQKDGDKVWTSDVINFIKERPGQYANLLFKKFCVFWGAWEPPDNDIIYERFKENCPLLRMPFVLVFGMIAPLGLVGMLFSMRRWWNKAFLLYLVFTIYMLATIAFFVQARFRIPIVPYLAMFGGFAIWYLYEAIKAKRYNILCFFVPALIVLYLLINFQTNLGWTYPILHPYGTCAESRDGVMLRDDSGEWHGKEFVTLDSPEKMVKKELIITEDIGNYKDALLLLHYALGDKGAVVININGKQFPIVPCNRLTYGRFFRTAEIGIEPQKYLKKGLNTITLRVIDGGNMTIPIDNWRYYKRSYLSGDSGKTWQSVSNGEIIIGLKFIRKLTATHRCSSFYPQY